MLKLKHSHLAVMFYKKWRIFATKGTIVHNTQFLHAFFLSLQHSLVLNTTHSPCIFFLTKIHPSLLLQVTLTCINLLWCSFVAQPSQSRKSKLLFISSNRNRSGWEEVTKNQIDLDSILLWWCGSVCNAEATITIIFHRNYGHLLQRK